MAQLFEEFAGLKDGMMLDGTGDNVTAARPVSMGNAFERPIVRLSAAAGEEYLVWLGADESGNFATGFFSRTPGFLPAGVNTGRIPP